VVSVTTGRPIAGTTQAAPFGYGLGVLQQTTPPLGRCGPTKARPSATRCSTSYFPRSGMIIARREQLPALGRDDLFTLAASVYQALQKAGLG